MISFEHEKVIVIDNFLTPELADNVYVKIDAEDRWTKMKYKNKNFHYSFSQNEDSELIKNIFLISNLKELIEETTGFSNITFPAVFLSKYEFGDYLSPHNDSDEGREYGFIYNVTRESSIEDGGVLHYINKNNEYDPILPMYNRLIIFKVDKMRNHFVSEVKKQNYKRQSLTGWFNTKKFDNLKKEKTII